MACVAADSPDVTSLPPPYLVTINLQAEEQATSLPDAAVQPTQVPDCCPSIEDVDSTVITNWTKPMVLLLIKSYEARKNLFKDPTKKKKVLWIEIAREMRCHGYNLTWDGCDKKWRNLKKTYCNIVNHNRKTTHGGQSWDYLLPLKAILGNSDDDDEKSLPYQATLPVLAVEDGIDHSAHIENAMQVLTHIPTTSDDLFGAVAREEKSKMAAYSGGQKFSSSQRVAKQILNRVRSSPNQGRNSRRMRRVNGDLPYGHPPSWVDQYLKKQADMELSRLEVMRDLRTMMQQYVETQKERNEVLKRFALAVEKLAEK